MVEFEDNYRVQFMSPHPQTLPHREEEIQPREVRRAAPTLCLGGCRARP